MKIVLECLWSGSPQFNHLPQELWSYDPVQQIIRSRKCETSLFPMSLFLKEDLQYHGDTEPSPCIENTLASMHVIEVVDVDLFEDGPSILQVDLVPQLSSLEEQQKEDVQAILKDFPHLFSSGSNDLGHIVNPDMCHRIELIEGATPPTRLRSMSSYSEREREFIAREIQMLLSLGIIQASTSPWISAPVVVRKQDDTLRLCIDFRPLNKVTVADPYPLPNIEMMLRRMSKSCYFSTVDIASAFWQVPMHEAHVKYTGFMTPDGKYEWLRMPFGLKNASSTFQRLMDWVVGNSLYADAYLDDVFVHSVTWKEHCMHLREVFTKLSQHRIKLKLPKCVFGAPTIRALGHVVGNGQMRPDPENIAAILNLPVPKDKNAVRSVLGAAGYYRGYIQDFALKTEPMSRLMKKNEPFVWTPECQQAFDVMKKAMASDPVLRMPNLSLPFVLTTDWSKSAIGAVLSQIDENTKFDHPVAFASRILTPAERNYSPTEGECLALVWAIEKFRTFLRWSQICCLY
jgi:predicted transcriptional regulator